jgi:NADH-quinone oxidoreductase subunit C
LSYLKINSLYKFSQLADIIALDFPQQPIRFVVNYNLLSLFYSTRILVQTKINEKLMLPSVVSLYSSSD